VLVKCGELSLEIDRCIMYSDACEEGRVVWATAVRVPCLLRIPTCLSAFSLRVGVDDLGYTYIWLLAGVPIRY